MEIIKKEQFLKRNCSYCTPAGARTLDTLIKSQVLYQLSYKRILGAFIFQYACRGSNPGHPD